MIDGKVTKNKIKVLRNTLLTPKAITLAILWQCNRFKRKMVEEDPFYCTHMLQEKIATDTGAIRL